MVGLAKPTPSDREVLTGLVERVKWQRTGAYQRKSQEGGKPCGVARPVFPRSSSTKPSDGLPSSPKSLPMVKGGTSPSCGSAGRAFLPVFFSVCANLRDCSVSPRFLVTRFSATAGSICEPSIEEDRAS